MLMPNLKWPAYDMSLCMPTVNSFAQESHLEYLCFKKSDQLSMVSFTCETFKRVRGARLDLIVQIRFPPTLNMCCHVMKKPVRQMIKNAHKAT